MEIRRGRLPLHPLPVADESWRSGEGERWGREGFPEANTFTSHCFLSWIQYVERGGRRREKGKRGKSRGAEDTLYLSLINLRSGSGLMTQEGEGEGGREEKKGKKHHKGLTTRLSHFVRRK